MQLSPSFFAHQTEALQFWSCPTSVLIFRDPTPPKSAGEPVQQAQAHPTSLKFRMPGAKVQHHPANIGFSPFFPQMHKAMRPLTRGTPRSQGAHTALTAPTKSLPSGLKLYQQKQWSDREIVLVAMVGQANHCIQQHVALAQLPLGAHRGVPDDGAFYQERGQGFKVVVLRRRSPPQI